MWAFTKVALLALLTTQAYTCTIPANASVEAFIVGNDPPADSATLGYTFNHAALVVNNITATRRFYGDILGMRHMFTFRATPQYNITYMSYSHGGKNGTGYQSGPELLNQKNNIEGLIEFLHLCDEAKVKAKGNRNHNHNHNHAYNSSTNNNSASARFAHFGWIVPDIRATQARMISYGVPIVKPVGVLPDATNANLRAAFGLADASDEEATAVLTNVSAIGFASFLIVADPDGNLIEIQPQN